MATQITTETRNHDEYNVGWVCALSKEQTAAESMLDQRHADLPKPPNDPNTYTLGSIGEHNIVIACLPEAGIGTPVAATVATWMISTFPRIKFSLMVGIGGGIPPKVRLGDVVVGTPEGQYPGVVQWDFGKKKEDGIFKRGGALGYLPAYLVVALANLMVEKEIAVYKIPEYPYELQRKWAEPAPKYPRSDLLEDVVFKAEKRDMFVHHGLIASGKQVIEDAWLRDNLDKSLGGDVLCVETEAIGLMNNFPCLVIRGICDYADSHKNKDWQEHAAAVAAAFAKEVLQSFRPDLVDIEPPGRKTFGKVSDAITTHPRTKLDRKEDVEILDWLTPIDYGPHQSDYHNRRQPGTGNWLLESEEFRGWLVGSKQTLFCPGIPGAGKTILTSIVVDFLTFRFSHNSEIGIAYIYCNFRRQNEQKIDDLLASVLKQLTQYRSSLPESVKHLYDQHRTKQTRPSLDEILVLLQSVAAMYSRVFIIVDALDECQASDGCQTRFLLELFNLQTRHRANIFATSRSIPNIVDRFKANLSIEIEIRTRPEDVAKYLAGNIRQLPSLVQRDTQLQKLITRRISELAGGMFFLAQLYLGDLADKLTPNDIRSTLATLPNQSRGLGEDQKGQVIAHVYGPYMERINGQMPRMKTLAMKVLLWIMCAKRQLTASELQHALATKAGISELDYGDLPHVGDMVSACAGLVTVDEKSGIIQLVHCTMQEYLRLTQERWFRDADLEITTTCVTYLSFNLFETGFCNSDSEFEERLRSNPFYHYAAHHWGHHVPKDKTPSLVIDFLKSEAKVEASCQALLAGSRHSNWSRNAPRRMTALHLAGWFGVSKAADELIRLGYSPDANDSYSRRPLWYAAHNGHAAVIKILAAAGADVNAAAGFEYYGQTALKAAARGGHLDAVEKLLAAGADVNATAGFKYSAQTALELAAQGGHLEVVEKLLAAGADVNVAAALGQIQLQVAARGGHLEVVKKLLEYGADVNAVDAHQYYGQTALHVAAGGGHLEVVKNLLAEGADVNAVAVGWREVTALHVAAGRSHLGILEKLLACGADADSKDRDGWTPLLWAAQKGHEGVVNLLLATGKVDVDSKEMEGRTPLSWAAQEGHEGVVNLLLATGKVDVDSKDLKGRTAFFWAAEKGYKAVLKLLSGASNVDTESYVSDDSSVFSTSASVLSTAPSSVPRIENVEYALQVVTEHLAYLLSEDLFLRRLYSQALQTMAKDRFFRNHDRLLKKFMLDMRRQAEDKMVIQALRVLRSRRQREQVTTQIYETFRPDTTYTNRKGMSDFIEQKEDREYRLELLFQQQQGYEKGTAEHYNDAEANNYAPAVGDVQVEEENQENEEIESELDEDEGEETEEESDDAPNAAQRLNSVVEFITNSPPFEVFKSNIHYFVNPPTTVKEAIESKQIKALKRLLRTRFDLLAVGEYSWLQELNDIGFNHDEMADLLFQQETDSPWIYFEPQTTNRAEIKIGHHLHGCVHQLNLSDEYKPESTASLQSPLQTGDWSDVTRTVQELCGLGGIAPKTRCLENWDGSVTFESDDSTACVSYAHQDEQVILSRVANTLHQLCIAIGHAQSAGLCCDSFTILRYPGRHPDDGSSLIEVCRIDFQLVVLMVDELEQLASMKGTTELRKPRALEVLDILLDGAIIWSSLETITGVLHSYSLAVQVLCLGFLSYHQAHVGPFQPFFLDTMVTKVRLLGSQTSPGSYTAIGVSLQKLTCFGEMLQDDVLVFNRLDVPAISLPALEKFDLLANFEDLVDTWGPGQFVFPTESKLPSAIGIGGGFVYMSDRQNKKFHWSRHVSPYGLCHGELDPLVKIHIGRPVTVNGSCRLDEGQIRAHCDKFLRPLGTYSSGWTLAERQVGFQAGNYMLLQVNAAYHRYPGRTLKQVCLEKKDEDLVSFLEEHWGVQVSLCTGVARRVPLREMVADLLPTFTNHITFGGDQVDWEILKTNHGIFEALRREGLRDWLRKLERPLHDLVLQLIRRILDTLRDTGLDREGKSLLVAWAYGDNTYHCFDINLRQGESSWARLLADSEDCATFAYISPKCLETAEIRCRGANNTWRNVVPLLETAVVVCSNCRPAQPAQPTTPGNGELRHEGTYYFKKLDSMLFVKALRPNAAVAAKLVEKSSSIPERFMRRLVSKAQETQRLRERRGIRGIGDNFALFTSVSGH